MPYAPHPTTVREHRPPLGPTAAEGVFGSVRRMEWPRAMHTIASRAPSPPPPHTSRGQRRVVRPVAVWRGFAPAGAACCRTGRGGGRAEGRACPNGGAVCCVEWRCRALIAMASVMSAARVAAAPRASLNTRRSQSHSAIRRPHGRMAPRPLRCVIPIAPPGLQRQCVRMAWRRGGTGQLS